MELKFLIIFLLASKIPLRTIWPCKPSHPVLAFEKVEIPWTVISYSRIETFYHQNHNIFFPFHYLLLKIEIYMNQIQKFVIITLD